ncbi:MAG TPA: ATP synthase F1 subunit gamma [Myxococcota bacterium]
MPNLKDIRRRIRSVKKTQQITRAMRMVAGAKLRRAQNAVTQARPYAERMRATLAEVARVPQDTVHPLLAPRPQPKRAEVVVVTSNRGLCGAFNANVLRFADRLVAAREREGVAVTITCVGRKAVEYFARRRRRQLGGKHIFDGWVSYESAAELAGQLSGRFASGDSDEILLVFSEFVSALSQTPRSARLLPAAPDAPEAAVGEASLPVEIEPSAEKLIAVLVPKAIEVEIFRALLENQAGEHAARMASMEAATRNTEDLISRLTLQFNRARQAAITKELVEIVSGAEALKSS